MTSSDDQQHAADLSPSPSGSAPVSREPPALAGRDRGVDLTVKETIESLVVALILAFVFRSFIVEAFVIPTGSMAPTLLGRHVPVTDPQTGYRFTVGVSREDQNVLPVTMAVRSPMTGRSFAVEPGTPARAGDRILVLKYVYMLSEPQRWDVIVFKAPHVPADAYIKRLVGLPGESVALLDGNVYVKPTGAETFRIARKIDRPEVQRAVFQPIYHSRFVPLEQGDAAGLYEDVQERPWTSPWVAQGTGWDVDGVTYRFSPRGDGGAGTIAFDFASHGYATPGMLYPYNQMPGSGLMLPQPVSDIRLAATVRPDRAGVGVTLATTAQLDREDGAVERVEARLDASGLASLVAVDLQSGATRPLADPVSVGPLRTGWPRRVELWYVDQAAVMWVDGEEVLRFTYDLPLDVLKTRTSDRWTPEPTISVTGGPASLFDVELDRDLFYGVEQDGLIARGGLVRRHPSQPADGLPLSIPPDAFWALGDNSPMSQDSRFWSETDAWVERRMFGAPVVDPSGLVPRDLLVGRAFFVYLPAPLPLTPGGRGIIPHFGAMRLIR